MLEIDSPNVDSIPTALCCLGSLTGEFNVELGRMQSKGEPFAEAPKIDIWVIENVSPGDDSNHTHSMTRAWVTLITDPDDNEYIVRGETVTPDEAIETCPDGFKRANGHVYNRFAHIEEAIEEMVALAVQLRNQQYQNELAN